MQTRVKICGITRIADALTAAEHGAFAIGLNFCPQSSRCLDLARAREISHAVSHEVAIFAVFVNPDRALVNEALDTLPLSFLQFHGDEAPEFCAQFGRPYVKALRVEPETDLLQYAARYSTARALLLDAFVAGQRGGTGHSFDWRLIPREMPLPIVLSGGLNPANVRAAIERARPWAVDVASGVESAPGIKDAEKIGTFMREVANADLRSP
jgi:phosphoribosylanthranilate isomerase